MINLDAISFDIFSYPNNIAILFSGGSDSTILLYLLLLDKATTKSSHNISIYVLDRYNQPLTHARNILNLLSNKLKTELKFINYKIPEVSQHLEIITASKMLELNHDIILWGINKYPNDTSIRPNHVFDFRVLNKVNYPFKHLYKHQIIKMFYDLEISDILDNTHSCGLNYDLPCGQCFNCKERKWAYEQIKKPVNLGK